jgi:hypothetical protein
MGSEARARRIGRRFPWPIGPIISRTLWRCGDCPERLTCIERHILRPAGARPIKYIISTIGRCPEVPGGHSTFVSRTAARFVHENCKGCRALASCCASVEWHFIPVTAEELTADLWARPLVKRVERCVCCGYLSVCVASWMEEMSIGLGSLLIGYLRMRWHCPRLSNVR